MWTCQRQSGGVKCGQRNTNRKKLCSACGKLRPKKRQPAHMTALKLTYEEYVELNGGEFCGVCGREPTPGRRLDRDHDHHTKEPRGLLCNRCNRALPSWITVRWLLDAAIYLVKSQLKSHDMTSHPRHISSEL